MPTKTHNIPISPMTVVQSLSLGGASIKTALMSMISLVTRLKANPGSPCSEKHKLELSGRLTRK